MGKWQCTAVTADEQPCHKYSTKSESSMLYWNGLDAHTVAAILVAHLLTIENELDAHKARR